MPLAGRHASPGPAPPPSTPPAEVEGNPWPELAVRQARLAWARLHRRALNVHVDDGPWLTDFLNALPCGACRAHVWQQVLRMPPAWGQGYFRWTVDLHNAVNVRLGKPLWAEPAARAHWTLVKS